MSYYSSNINFELLIDNSKYKFCIVVNEHLFINRLYIYIGNNITISYSLDIKNQIIDWTSLFCHDGTSFNSNIKKHLDKYFKLKSFW